MFSLFGPGIDPIDERFVPKDGVLRLENPMPFIGEQQKLRRNFLKLQRREQLQALSHRDAIIQLAMNHQRGRAKFLDEVTWRPARIHIEAVPRHPGELPNRERKLLGLERFAAQVEYTIVRNERLEAPRVPEHPSGHV